VFSNDWPPECGQGSSLLTAFPRPLPLLRRLQIQIVTRSLTALALLSPLSVVSAQQVADPARRLQRIDITRQGVFDSVDARQWFARIANRLHVTTQARVIERELLLRMGDPLDSARAAETGRNLRRLAVFRDVTVDTSADGRTLRVVTRDAWSTKPYANYRSTGSQTLISAGILETNFLGLAATLDARFVQDPDRSLFRLAFAAPRIFANRVGSLVFFNKLSDGRSVGAVVEQPFFSLSSRTAARATFVTSTGRVIRFRNGVLTPSDSLDRQFTLATVGAAHALRASPRGFLRIGVDAQYRRDDFTPRRGVPVVAARTVTGAVTGFVDASRARFVVTRNYRVLGQPEDVDLSTTVRLGVAVAPKAFGYDRSGAGPVLFAQTGVRLPYGFATLAGRANGLASAGALDSGTAIVAATVVLQPHPRHLFVAFSMLGWEKNPFPGEEFDLGLARGPRAFPLHAFTGDRQRFSAVEYRFTALPNIAGLFAAGVAAFAETGGAWYNGSRPRDGANAGVGLRFAPLRSAANVGATRIDLARRFATDRQAAGWVVVVGSGFTFDFVR